MYGYNSAMQESSRYTPFEAMFGRLAKLPVDFNTSKNYDADEKLSNYLSSGNPSEFERVAKRQRTETKIKANIKKAQEKQKKYYDKKQNYPFHYRRHCFEEGLSEEEKKRWKARLSMDGAICYCEFVGKRSLSFKGD